MCNHFKTQQELIDVLYRLTGLAAAIDAIIGLDNHIGPKERHALKMIGEFIEIEASNVLDYTETGVIVVADNADNDGEAK